MAKIIVAASSPPPPPIDPALQRLRSGVRGAYDLQDLRIKCGQRLVSNFKVMLGIAPGEKETDAQAVIILKSLKDNFKLLTDGVASRPRSASFKGNDIISSFAEMCLVEDYFVLRSQESRQFRQLKYFLKGFRIFEEWLTHIRGIAEAMSGVIISGFNIHKARYPSSLWSYAGLDVAPDGRGRSRRKEHLRDIEYIDKKGKPQTRKGLTFSPYIRTKLLGVLGPNLIRTRNEQYYAIYINYKHRLENHAVYGTHLDGKEYDGIGWIGPARRNSMAIRYMVKQFLVELYKVWRAIEGLPVNNPYAEEKLGRKHSA